MQVCKKQSFTRKQIAEMKAKVLFYYSGLEITRLQFHEWNGTFSGYGRQLTFPDCAIGNIDKYGNARYRLASLNDDWFAIEANWKMSNV